MNNPEIIFRNTPVTKTIIQARSSIGYHSKQVKIFNDSVLYVYLEMNPLSLDVVVVTGYTSQKVKEITGSVTSVGTDLLATEPVGQVY